jgi:hypothetical protein
MLQIPKISGKTLKFCSRKFRNFARNFKKIREIIFFTDFYDCAVSEMFSSERALKMLQNDSLDVKKLDDTDENEPLPISKI